jgi:hypothetical protein
VNDIKVNGSTYLSVKNDCEIESPDHFWNAAPSGSCGMGCPYFLFSDLVLKYVLVNVKMNEEEVDAGFEICN